MTGLRRRAAIVLASVPLAVVLAACATPTDNDTRSATAGLPSLRLDLEAHEWVLDAARSTPRVLAGDQPTIVFDDDRVHGRGPCNTFRGSVDYGDDDEVSISDIAASLRSCGGATDRAETAYFAALRRVDEADVDDDDRMELTGPGVGLRYEAFDAREALTRTWHIVNVNTGDAIVGVITGSDPTVTFADGGDVTLQTGCNTARGSWEIDDDRLTVGSLRQGLKACDEPAGVMDQEAALTRALEDATRVEITPDTLTVLDGQGRIALVATAEEPG